MMLNGITNDAESIPEEEAPQFEKTKQFDDNAEFRPRKKLSYVQKVKLKDRKTLFTLFNRWFWASPKWTIALMRQQFFSCFLL